mmetsp:Transcript_13338/g.49548  ORF Transcript_13338/g.49548 Transcript_13338/m.49548 type:complete len:762 (+) Transcript_13338:227-2512(+)
MKALRVVGIRQTIHHNALRDPAASVLGLLAAAREVDAFGPLEVGRVHLRRREGPVRLTVDEEVQLALLAIRRDHQRVVLANLDSASHGFLLRWLLLFGLFLLGFSLLRAVLLVLLLRRRRGGFTLLSSGDGDHGVQGRGRALLQGSGKRGLANHTLSRIARRAARYCLAHGLLGIPLVVSVVFCIQIERGKGTDVAKAIHVTRGDVPTPGRTLIDLAEAEQGGSAAQFRQRLQVHELQRDRELFSAEFVVLDRVAARRRERILVVDVDVPAGHVDGHAAARPNAHDRIVPDAVAVPHLVDLRRTQRHLGGEVVKERLVRLQRQSRIRVWVGRTQAPRPSVKLVDVGQLLAAAIVRIHLLHLQRLVAQLLLISLLEHDADLVAAVRLELLRQEVLALHHSVHGSVRIVFFVLLVLLEVEGDKTGEVCVVELAAVAHVGELHDLRHVLHDKILQAQEAKSRPDLLSAQAGRVVGVKASEGLPAGRARDLQGDPHVEGVALLLEHFPLGLRRHRALQLGVLPFLLQAPPARHDVAEEALPRREIRTGEATNQLVQAGLAVGEVAVEEPEASARQRLLLRRRQGGAAEDLFAGRAWDLPMVRAPARAGVQEQTSIAGRSHAMRRHRAVPQGKLHAVFFAVVPGCVENGTLKAGTGATVDVQDATKRLRLAQGDGDVEAILLHGRENVALQGSFHGCRGHERVLLAVRHDPLEKIPRFLLAFHVEVRVEPAEDPHLIHGARNLGAFRRQHRKKLHALGEVLGGVRF